MRKNKRTRPMDGLFMLSINMSAPQQSFVDAGSTRSNTSRPFSHSKLVRSGQNGVRFGAVRRQQRQCGEQTKQGKQPERPQQIKYGEPTEWRKQRSENELRQSHRRRVGPRGGHPRTTHRTPGPQETNQEEGQQRAEYGTDDSGHCIHRSGRIAHAGPEDLLRGNTSAMLLLQLHSQRWQVRRIRRWPQTEEGKHVRGFQYVHQRPDVEHDVQVALEKMLHWRLLWVVGRQETPTNRRRWRWNLPRYHNGGARLLPQVSHRLPVPTARSLGHSPRWIHQPDLRQHIEQYFFKRLH